MYFRELVNLTADTSTNWQFYARVLRITDPVYYRYFGLLAESTVGTSDYSPCQTVVISDHSLSQLLVLKITRCAKRTTFKVTTLLM